MVSASVPQSFTNLESLLVCIEGGSGCFIPFAIFHILPTRVRHIGRYVRYTDFRCLLLIRSTTAVCHLWATEHPNCLRHCEGRHFTQVVQKCEKLRLLGRHCISILSACRFKLRKFHKTLLKRTFYTFLNKDIDKITVILMVPFAF